MFLFDIFMSVLSSFYESIGTALNQVEECRDGPADDSQGLLGCLFHLGLSGRKMQCQHCEAGTKSWLENRLNQGRILNNVLLTLR